MVLALTREELVRLSSSRKTRTTVFTSKTPCEWRPHTVVDPRHAMYFTDAGAWDFVVDLITDGHELKPITLRAPPGAIAYEILTAGVAGAPKIYIKIQIMSNMVYGRSFHYSLNG